MATDQHHSRNGYSEDEADSAPGSAAKRRSADSGNASAGRAKRARYISVACNECKRRKIKCNGQTPCQRCGNLSLECLYATNSCSGVHLRDTEDFQQMKAQIASLQEQVNALFASISAPRSTGQTPDGYPSSALSPNNHQQRLSLASLRAKPTALHGPMSANYGLDVAKHSLASMGITPENGPDGVPSDQPSPERSIDPELTATPHYEKDPIWSISRDEALRLLRVYEDEIGVTYPMLDMERIRKHVMLLWTFLEAALRTGLMPGSHVPGADALDDEDTNIIKLLMANTLSFESSGHEDLAQRLFQSVAPHLEQKLWLPAETKGIKLIALASMWYFHQDNETMAWRLIGIAGRMCMGLGMHRVNSLERGFPDSGAREWALKLFWTVHSYDRRWSFGTGLPFSIPDADVDPLLPKPDDIYPRAMVGFHNLMSKVWYATLSNEGEPKREEMQYLDYEIQQWYNQLAPQFKLDKSQLREYLHSGARGARRLRVLIYMQTNSARLSVYRPILQTATSIMQNLDYAQTAVEIAKDTISLLTRVNQVSDLYRSQQVRFNHFLVNAIAALFLAVCHAPAEFVRDVREEFFMALELVKGFKASAPSSKRLWKTILQLRGLFKRLDGFRANETSDPHSNAALAMAGLAGQPVDNFDYNNIASSIGSSPFDGMQISNELTNLFEIAGGSNNNNGSIWAGLDAPTTTEGLENQYPDTTTRQGEQDDSMGIPGTFAYGDEFSKIMSQIF